MPLEYYFGLAVAVVLLVLLISLVRGRRTTRRVSDKSEDTSQLTHQLSRIADALEKLVVQSEASPLQPKPVPAPLQKPSEERVPQPTVSQPTPVPEPTPAEVAKSSEPAKPHVVLSMFGR
jgi:hypothetical protein